MKVHNYGLDILRIWMSFEVVLNHYYRYDDYDRLVGVNLVFYRMGKCAVPIFMLMSFYLTSHQIKEASLNVFSRRLRRLFIPYIGGGLITYLIHKLAEVLFRSKDVIDINALKYQLLFGFGRNLNAALWYLFDLIILTILFFIFFKLKIERFMIPISFISAVVMQYTETNYQLFYNFIDECKYSFGRLLEMVPFACLGIFLGLGNVMNKAKIYRKTLILFIIIALMVVFKYEYLFPYPLGYGYQGLFLILVVPMIFCFFYILTFSFNFKLIKNTIEYIAKYTLGVFCIHIGVGYLLENSVFKYSNRGTLIECIFIYISSLTLAIIIGKIPNKWIKQIVM